MHANANSVHPASATVTTAGSIVKRVGKAVSATVTATATITALKGLCRLGVIQRVLQNLLRERVPIRDIRSIAEALAGATGKSQDPVALTAIARVALCRQIVQSIIGGEQNLPVVTIDPSLEQLLLSTVQQAQKAGADDGAFIEPSLADRLQASLISAAQKQEMAGKPLVLLVGTE